MIDFLLLAERCAPTVAPKTLAAIVQVESSYNPFAIGVVGGRLQRQPKTLEEALNTARQLTNDGWNFSVGVAQVNRYNFAKYNIDAEQVFDPCTNLRVGSKILEDCYNRALVKYPDPQNALKASFSCYYSGNFTRGFKPDVMGKPSYVEKIVASASLNPKAIPVVPSIEVGEKKPMYDKAADSPKAPVKLKAKKIESSQGSDNSVLQSEDTSEDNNPSLVF